MFRYPRRPEYQKIKAVEKTKYLDLDFGSVADSYELQGPDWKAVASDLSYVLISGDFSSRGYEQLRKAIARHDRIIAKLQDPLLEPDMPSTGWVSAVGAAKTAKERWFEDYMYLQRSHDEL
ncbi:MAG: hypothetical protein Q9228_007212 [Teloschistes exilis]